MNLEMINSKNLIVPLIVDYKYRINNRVLIFNSEDSLCYNFMDDSITITFEKDKYSYEPIYNINDYVFYNSKIYQIKDVDKKAYLSALSISDYIVVTCDSTSMISEAAITGKPIYVAATTVDAAAISAEKPRLGVK